MKVTLPSNYRNWFTLDDLDIAKEVIKVMKDDESKVSYYANLAVAHALDVRYSGKDYCKEILKADAEVCKNNRAFNVLFDGSLNFDVWVTAIAQTMYGFIEVQAYLSDIWSMSYDNNYTPHMLIHYYAEQK